MHAYMHVSIGTIPSVCITLFMYVYSFVKEIFVQYFYKLFLFEIVLFCDKLFHTLYGKHKVLCGDASIAKSINSVLASFVKK